MSRSNPENRAIWEAMYARSDKVNRYPYDAVVTFVMRNFAGRANRSDVQLLDYGCGGGGNTAFMAAEGFTVHAVDSSASAALHASNTVRLVAQRAAKIVVADFAALPYPDRFLDAVIDRQSLGQNRAARLPQMVAEIARVLKPGGLYFGINFSMGHPQLRFGRDFGDGDFGDFSDGVFKGIGFRHFFAAAELRHLLREFEIRDLRILSNANLLDADRGSEEILVVAAKKA